ncbi:hypothetical protein W97_03441 [Coniosporium apollinis CBS 100218]|uniref:Autophagy-related protein 14 n=1 Tax=Coniosporium apollinis (strain CBS 100218) TaxID=1168221 RepID=R7YRE3_CONA1|nr:uncharacterized protein W97_03441 [Coniosporium apollinis CBS 100218]EON64211.1 hypothetical protein W97_03441 [Coniosporium apollinis CBS 100218]
MDCDICGKGLGPKVPLHCATCARSALYPLRIEHVTTLLDKEKLGKHVEAVANGTTDPAAQSISLSGLLVNTHESSKKLRLERTVAETTQTAERINLITEQVELLKRQMEEVKKEMAARKEAMARRCSDLASANHDVEARRNNELEKVLKSVRHANQRLERTHTQTVDARMYLCRAAAELAGLKEQKRMSRDGTCKMGYFIGGIPITDLRNLHTASPRQLTASLTLVARLLVQISHYLGLRLPAEIVLPHKDWPLPTIYSLGSSYTSRDVSFPGSSEPASSTNSPAASRTLEHRRPPPRPRTLYIHSPLPKLVKEDPAAYSVFVEGVTLLAWDIAWLCYTQGMRSEFADLEAICQMGKNLHQLLVARPPAPTRHNSSRSVTPAPDSQATPLLSSPSVTVGHFSHGTAHSFLGAAAGNDYMRDWQARTPTKLIDKVKITLAENMQNIEWEMLDEKEWADAEGALIEEPEVIGARAQKATDKPRDGGSVVSQSTVTQESAQTEAGRARGVNGWTKLKTRNGESSK